MSISKTAILEPQNKNERSTGIDITGNRQKLNKTMSDSQIDTSRIRQKYARQTDLLDDSTTSERNEQNDQEADTKNGCAIM